MSFLMNIKIEEFNSANDNFTKEEAEQILEIIMSEESLSPRQAIHYNFIEAFDTYGVSWVDTSDLFEYVIDGEEKQTINYLKTMKDIMNTPTLFLLSSGRWIGWEY